MPKDVIITPASASVLFRNSTSTDTAYIQLDENDNLSISNVSGGLSLGTPGSDVYIGDGINNVDIVFEQDGEVRALTGKTLTLGAAGSTVNLTGTVTSTSAISINPGGAVTGLNLNNNDIVGVNKLTFNDPGPNEGIVWSGGNLWNIWESPDNLTTNSGGNLQFVQNGVRKATLNTLGQLDLPVGTGTAPLVISSTTVVTNLNADLLDGQHGSYYAPLNSPNLTGTPVAPTASAGTNTTQIATTAFVQTAVANLVDASPTTLDTLNELAAALGDDPNFATTVSNSIGLKLDSSAYTASDVLTKIKTVDGAGSGLDADLLDGYNSADFTRKSENATITGDWTFEETIKFNGGSSQSLSIGSAWFNAANGAILLDDNGHKRISWNDGGGNFNIRAGNYHNGTTTIAAKGTGDTDGGAVHIVMNTDGGNAGYFAVSVAPVTTAGQTVTFNNSLSLSTEASAAGAGGLQYNGAQVWHAANDGTGSGLDADLLDGNHASAFALANHIHDYLSSSTTSTQNGYFGNIYLYDDSTPSHYLAVTNSANLTADRTLSVNVNDADRTISLSGNLTVSSAATVSGTNTGDQTNIAGNAATATALQTARTIGGVSFDGTANINLPGVNTAGNQNTTGNAANVTGIVAVANGGTGATSQAGARTGLGATTIGSNLFTLANPGAVTFPRFNADNTVSSLSAADFKTALDITAGSGTVTSVSGTGTVSGLTLTGTVTTSGNITLGGTLSVAASNFASQTANTFLAAPNAAAGVPTFRTIVASDIPTLNQNTTGSAATLTTARTLTIGSTGKTFNGSANVSWSITEILPTSANLQINSLGVGTAASATAGEIRATNNITAYFSDERLKTKLGNIENALEKVCLLSGFYHEANELAQSFGYKKIREVGVSAQEVQAVLPEVVAPAPIDDNYLTVRYERMVPLLIEAIKELKSEIEQIKKEMR